MRKFKSRGTVVLNAPGPEAGVGGAEVGAVRLAQELLSHIKDLKGSNLTGSGRVDYPAIASGAGYGAYRELAARLGRVDLQALAGTATASAFWINIYNALVVDAIISTGVRNSVKEITGFYKRLKYSVGAYELSLDDIEHGILRANSRAYMRSLKQFGRFDARRALALKRVDPRIHFALVCGAMSCPPVKFYTPASIDSELDMASASFINSPEVVVNASESTLTVSQIFKWYASDFGGHSGVLDFIAGYLDDEDSKRFVASGGSKLKIKYLPYDWGLN